MECFCEDSEFFLVPGLDYEGNLTCYLVCGACSAVYEQGKEEEDKEQSMKIYICDKCGFKKEFSQIVGKEFSYSKYFETLVPEIRVNGITDVCKKCYESIDNARLKAFKDLKNSQVEEMKKAVMSK